MTVINFILIQVMIVFATMHVGPPDDQFFFVYFILQCRTCVFLSSAFMAKKRVHASILRTQDSEIDILSLYVTY